MDIVSELATALKHRGQMMATVESCTGGGIAARLTDVAGSSAWFERGFVTYSNSAKSELVGVASGLIEQHGAVSEQVAEAMARGGVLHSAADWAVSVTGVAGPDGGSPAKPVGTVWIGWARLAGDRCLDQIAASSLVFHFDGDRLSVRAQSIDAALRGLLDRIV